MVLVVVAVVAVVVMVVVAVAAVAVRACVCDGGGCRRHMASRTMDCKRRRTRACAIS